MALKKGINVRNGMQFGEPGATSASELAYDANTTTKQKIDALATEVASKADLTDLAPAFSTATAYTVGQYVSYGGNIYKCTSAHSAGAWAAGDFTLVAVGSELESKQNATDNNLQTTNKTVVGAVNELKSGLNGLLKYKVFGNEASDTTNHLYSTDVPASQYVCVGGCTPYNPNFCVQVSNIQVTSTGFIRYRLYDVASNQVVSDNNGYTVYLVFVDKSMLSELVITP